MAASVRSNPVPKFVQAETVLCYEPDLTKSRVLYEAKVLEVDFTKDEKGKKVPEYFIHFNGWNKSWDRWVVEDQVLKNSEANRALKAKLHEQACKFQKKRKQRHSTSSQDTSHSNDSNSNATKAELEAENVDQPKVEIEIPSQLKLKLEDDCYFVKRKKKLVQLPRTPCVEDILEEYYQYYLQTNSESSAHLVKELMDGLKIYFNFTLPTLLLYNFEREQFRNIMQIGPVEVTHNDSEPSGNVPSDEKCSIVSSTTESPSAANDPTNSPREKDKRILRRRALRSNVAQNDQQTSSTSQTSSENANQNDNIDQSNQTNMSNNEESQSSTVSSTSSPSDNSNSRLSLKRKAKEIEEESETSTTQPSPGLCSSLPLTAALLSASCKVLPSKVYGPEHLLRLFVKLPGLLGKTDMPEINLTALLDHIDFFLKYLVERSAILFHEDVYQSFL